MSRAIIRFVPPYVLMWSLGAVYAATQPPWPVYLAVIPAWCWAMWWMRLWSQGSGDSE